VFLSRFLHDALLGTLRALPEKGAESQVALCNELLELLATRLSGHASDAVAEPAERLLSLDSGSSTSPQVARPEVPLAFSALLVNGRDQPRVGAEIAKELASADRVDLLCAFVKWYGFRYLREPLEELVRRGGTLRVLTTTYIGATDRKALDALARMGAQVRVAYETGRTKLHAKAWLFRRATGFSTAYVGSSNLSKSALLDGLEWNVRLSNVEHPHLLDTFGATFEEYWESPDFETYDPVRDAPRFDAAIQRERGGESALWERVQGGLEVRPWRHQEEMLEALETERTVHGRWHNLVVAATGTGKTVLAGLDYRRLRAAGAVDSLLFVAHREEILQQSLQAFRDVLRRGDFGELLVGGRRPEAWRHVFASVQSLTGSTLADIESRHFDMVIVDEFHHAAAPTYEALLGHLRPKALLGLTATPERSDGLDVTKWFDGRMAVELRLWDALERGLLSPFQYFGVHDDVDLTDVRWSRGRYDLGALDNLYTGHDARARKVGQAVLDLVAEPSAMRGLGFCVGIEHACWMARFFDQRLGLPSAAVTSRSTAEERRAALTGLRDGTLKVLFTVDLFNEGVDVPEVDTVLFLRPTESSTVFLQQLGRGLRRAEGKACLTVIDFIGRQHASFRFDRKYRGLLLRSRRELAAEVREGFPHLPPGCHMQLDAVAARVVLENLRRSLQLDWPGMAAELRELSALGRGALSLREFLRETDHQLEDLYRGGRAGWLGLRRLARVEASSALDADWERRIASGIGRLTHADDAERIEVWRSWFVADAPPDIAGASERQQRLARMLHFLLWGPNEPLERMAELLAKVWDDEGRRREIQEVLELLQDRRRHVTRPVAPDTPCPLHVHATYRRDEIVAAFGRSNPGALRQGVMWVPEENADFFLVTLRKTEKHFSPATRYRDRAITPELFHWESQHTTPEGSETGQRYIHHVARGSAVHLFVRESKSDELGAMPFFYAGRARYESHQGQRPMAIRWQLETPLPLDVFRAMKVAAG
jgi:superfamily II DNA or RNA helicase/HKD family nuclease